MTQGMPKLVRQIARTLSFPAQHWPTGKSPLRKNTLKMNSAPARICGAGDVPFGPHLKCAARGPLEHAESTVGEDSTGLGCA
jgi:hypothetical protein